MIGNFCLESSQRHLVERPLPSYIYSSIKSRADALANLPGPGKVAPVRGCGHKAIKRAESLRQPSSVGTEGGYFHAEEIGSGGGHPPTG
jgi:hypothetical protein